MQPRAIETRYQGYRFRSRLEARWAVFFDALALRWEYEPEGFELKAGRYLPDFSIGNSNDPQWLEVKADMPSPLEVTKMKQLCAASCRYGLLVWGLPGQSNFAVVHKDGHVCDSSTEALGEVTGTPLSEYLVVAESEFAIASVAARSARFEHGESGAKL